MTPVSIFHHHQNVCLLRYPPAIKSINQQFKYKVILTIQCQRQLKYNNQFDYKLSVVIRLQSKNPFHYAQLNKPLLQGDPLLRFYILYFFTLSFSSNNKVCLYPFISKMQYYNPRSQIHVIKTTRRRIACGVLVIISTYFYIILN